MQIRTTNQMIREFRKVLNMKPETVERRTKERRAERARRQAEHVKRLRANVQKLGPGTIWDELLMEAEQRLAKLEG